MRTLKWKYCTSLRVLTTIPLATGRNAVIQLPYHSYPSETSQFIGFTRGMSCR